MSSLHRSLCSPFSSLPSPIPLLLSPFSYPPPPLFLLSPPSPLFLLSPFLFLYSPPGAFHSLYPKRHSWAGYCWWLECLGEHTSWRASCHVAEATADSTEIQETVLRGEEWIKLSPYLTVCVCLSICLPTQLSIHLRLSICNCPSVTVYLRQSVCDCPSVNPVA